MYSPSISGFHKTGVNNNIGAINAFIVGSTSLYLAEKIPMIDVYKTELIKINNMPRGKVKITLESMFGCKINTRININGKWWKNNSKFKQDFLNTWKIGGIAYVFNKEELP